MIGKIHSIETMGLVDGPGIRFVVFFQGCKLRCSYCHNPDTWNLNEGKEITAKELLKRALRFKPYFKNSGGITCSGGDPLMQPEFLVDFLKLCKENGLHTTLDTSGFGLGRYEEILNYTDLVILDIKHVNKNGYKELTGGNIEEFEMFSKELIKSNKKIWIRHVVVPKITDSEEYIQDLNKIIKKFKNVEKIELIPYHTLGVDKYSAMGIEYNLNNTKPMSKEKIEQLKKIIE